MFSFINNSEIDILKVVINLDYICVSFGSILRNGIAVIKKYKKVKTFQHL